MTRTPSLLRKAALLLLLAPAIASAAEASTPQEQAEFLAGIDLPAGSVLSELQKTPSYRSHQKELQEKWAFCKQARYSAMQSWAEANLRKDRSSREVLRYLFGGPDFLNAFAFFPDVGTMVLGGLEPVGEVPAPESLKPGSFVNSLSALRQALRTSLYCGYFITSEMGGQLHQGAFRGVLPVLYTELALTGNRIQSVEMVKPFGSPGVKITYVRPGHVTPQTLYYFQANLANGAECQRFLSWLGEQGSGPAYLKAASYLLHGSEFSQARNFLLNTSTLVVEDDSGIPFRYFDPGTWKVRVFGNYASPLPIFSGYAQHDFKAAYSTPANAGPIKFGAGYHVVPAHANILLATRTAPVASVAKALPTPTPKPTSTPMPTPAVQMAQRPAPVTAPAQTAKPAPEPYVAGRGQSLAQLENEELRIRADQSISREEKMHQLREIWTLQLIAMGKAPQSSARPSDKAGAKNPSGNPAKPAATPARNLSEALESPTPKAARAPSPQPAATQAPAAPETQPTPVSTPTPSPETKSQADAMPSSTPSETPQAAPQATPQASPEPAPPAPAEETTN